MIFYTVPLKEVETNVTIKGFVANVVSCLTYVNNKDSPIEAEFVFPLDDSSAVYKFEADINGQHIVAECQEKNQVKLDNTIKGFNFVVLKFCGFLIWALWRWF